MGFMDFLKGGKKCAYCKKETEELPYSKKFDEGDKQFCSRECSRSYRIERKKKAKGQPTAGRTLPW